MFVSRKISCHAADAWSRDKLADVPDRGSRCVHFCLRFCACHVMSLYLSLSGQWMSGMYSYRRLIFEMVDVWTLIGFLSKARMGMKFTLSKKTLFGCSCDEDGGPCLHFTQKSFKSDTAAFRYCLLLSHHHRSYLNFIRLYFI